MTALGSPGPALKGDSKAARMLSSTLAFIANLGVTAVQFVRETIEGRGCAEIGGEGNEADHDRTQVRAQFLLPAGDRVSSTSSIWLALECEGP